VIGRGTGFGLLTTLDHKLMRDLWRLRGPAFAITLMIAAGIAMAIMSLGMMRSLEATRNAYYDAYRFADLFASVKRAPESVRQDIADLPGVQRADSRITAFALADLPGVADPINARLHSLTAKGRPSINDLVLRNGRWPDAGHPDEALVNEAFLLAVKLSIGDRLAVILNGKRESLKIVGSVLSPEYVYAIPPGQLFPDNTRYAILWLNRDALAAAFNMTGAFNELVLRLDANADRTDLIRQIDARLAPYGSRGAYLRNEQISDRFVTNELAQLRVMTGILPPMFLGVAAFLTHIVLSRLIDTERETIGLLKAFGYRNSAVSLHYVKLAAVIGLFGLALGILTGIGLGRALAGMYQDYFAFPFLRFHVDADVYAIAVAAALAPTVGGCMLSIRKAAALTPAAAMQPPKPPYYGGMLTNIITRITGLDQLTRIILRGVVRRPLRTLITALGIGTALALYITSAGSLDNIETMIQMTFDRAEREDLAVTFVEPRGRDVVADLARMPGVLRAEPMRAATATLSFNGRSRRETVLASDPGSDLSRLIDLDGHIVEPPSRGLVLSSSLARNLGAGVGDLVDVTITEGLRPIWRAPVVALVDSPIGSPVFMSLTELDRRMLDGERVSGVYLAVEGARRDALLSDLRVMPTVAGITMVELNRQSIRDTIAESMGIMTLFTTGLAVLIVIGVVYNNARISLAERARDLASLRVLGFRGSEAAYLLIGELAILTLTALPLGIAMGIALSRYMVNAFSSDLFTIPYGLSTATVARGVLVVIASTGATSLLIARRVNRLDLVAVLKTRD
jgi:putative ABC transport system permease protein